MSSDPPRSLRDDLGELQARLAVRTAELDQVQKALADQEETLQRLATRRAMRAPSIARYKRDLALSTCLLAGIVLVLVAQSRGWVALLGAVAFLLSSGVVALRKLHTQHRMVHDAPPEATPPSIRHSAGDEANQPDPPRTVGFRHGSDGLGVSRCDLQHPRSDVHQLILAAAHENDGRLGSFVECREICQAMWGLELEIDEISIAVGQLVDDGQLLDEGTHLRLSSSSSDEVAMRVRTSTELEATAFSEWEIAVRRMMPSLGHQQMMQLQEDLTVWIRQVIVEHGMEAALVLYPEHEPFKARLDAIWNSGFEFLPARDPQTMLERPTALRAFLDRMTSIQRHYFHDLVTTSYFVSGITLEPATLVKIHGLLSGQRLYLDTNVVYSLLKLDGPRAYAKTRRVVELSRQLGYRVCVTPWTVTEMKESVRLARMRLAGRRPSPQTVSSLPPDRDDEVFIRAFRQTERETGLSLEDFLALYEEVDRLLGAEGVEVIDEGCQAIDAVVDRLDDQIAELERVREGPEKPRPLQEHDVKHRLLMQTLRGTERRRFSNVGYLMLSNDRALCKFADTSRDSSTELPFAVWVDGWAHIVRSLTPRTDDYAMTMTRILDTPSLRQGRMSHRDVVEALARIEVCKTYPETLRTRALVDAALSVTGEVRSGARLGQRFGGRQSNPETEATPRSPRC